jgi:hypothetical protein
MADDTPSKPRRVQPTSRGYKLDRTNDLRIDRDDAQRLIARYLREKMNPGDANEMSSRIVAGLVSNAKSPSRPALAGWRMIPEYPPENVIGAVASAFKAVRLNTADNYSIARDAWKTVYKHGTSLPDDIVA